MILFLFKKKEEKKKGKEEDYNFRNLQKIVEIKIFIIWTIMNHL